MNWDLSSYFAAFDGPEMARYKHLLREDTATLRTCAANLPAMGQGELGDWERVVLDFEGIVARVGHLSSYVNCLSAADARNEAYRREKSDTAALEAEVEKLEVELLRGIKDLPEDRLAAFVGRPGLLGAGHFLRRLHEEARHTMSPEKEVLSADLGLDGIGAWGRLYSTVSGKLEFDMAYPDGRTERVPMAQRRSLMESPDRAVRRAAFEGGNASWSRVEDVAAAALNAISGTRLSLNRHRGVDHFLDIALRQAGIARKTLDAMMEAIFSELDFSRRILRLKARSQRTAGVAMYDLSAPLPLPVPMRPSWEEAQALVRKAFDRAYPALGGFLGEMLGRRWIEWEPRPGKRPGAFCTRSLITREPRVFMTYNGALGDVRTLAHEVGHAFHGHVMRDLRVYAHFHPMTLAESASTFGEMILTLGLLDDPSVTDPDKALILDMEVSHGSIYLLDIPTRYEFEKALYEERAAGEVPVSRLKELMIEVQRRIFGDALEMGGEDPYFWASKLHFYITGVTFYNFPYTFGFLLSRGLYSLFRQEGPGFLPRYEEFLRISGSDTPEAIASRTLGQDLQAPDFWVRAIRTLEDPLNHLEATLPGLLAQV